MEISVIASGSNGNCYYIEDKGTGILVEAGKSCREIVRRMDRLGKNIEDAQAILVSHCHSDHTRGAEVLHRKYKIPVYATTDVHNDMGYFGEKVKHFQMGQHFKIGGLEIRPIETSHDVNSCGFVINNFGIFTDTGIVTRQMVDAMPRLKGVLLESNHDIDMLIKGPYPAYLKYRILGERGHLSNIHASELVQEKGNNLQLCLLGHLSAVNNTINLTKNTYETIVKRKTEYCVLSRDEESGSWIL